MRALYF